MPENQAALEQRNETMTMGDFMALKDTPEAVASKPSEDVTTYEEFMSQPAQKVNVVQPIPEEHRNTFLLDMGLRFTEGINYGVTSFNDLLGFVTGLNSLDLYKKTFVTPGQELHSQVAELTKSENLGSKIAYDFAEQLGSLGVTLPIDMITGGATKAALAGNVLPAVEAILTKIPSFALGSGWRGLISGVREAENPIEAVPMGMVKAAEDISFSTLYAYSGAGLKGLRNMVGIGAANTYYEAAKEGRIPSRDEVIQGAAEGAAYATVFSLIPAIREGTRVLNEKAALGEYQKQIDTHLQAGNLPEAMGVADKILSDERIRPEIKEALNTALVPKAQPKPRQEFLEGIYQKAVNRFQSIENLVERAKELGAKIEPGIDAGLSAERYLSITNQAKNTLEQGTYQITKEGNVVLTGEGLKPILEKYDTASRERNTELRQAELKEYLIATRTIKDLQRPRSEFDKTQIVSEGQVQEAQNTVASLKKKYGGDLSVLEDTAKRLYDYQKRVLHLLVDSGNISEGQYESIITRNPNYVPFDRIMPEEKTAGIPVSKGRFSGAKSPVKRIKGSELEIYDPIESMIKNTYKIMDIAARNKVFQDVYIFKDIPELGIKEIEAPIIPVANVTHKAAIDMEFQNQLVSFAKSLGAKFKTTGQIGRNLGVYYPSRKEITRKFATPGEVVSHETAHFFDDRFSLKQRFFKRLKATEFGVPGKENAVTSELLGLMERMGESANRMRKPAERFADGFEWWLTHRDLAKRDLPLFSKEMETIIGEVPELKPILGIEPKPAISVETMQETIFRPSPFKPAGNVLEGYIEGKRKYLEVSQNLYEAMSGLNETSSNMLIKILSRPAQWLRVGATTTPEFILRNPIRDQWTALIQTDLGWKPFVDTTASMADIIGKSKAYNDWIRSGGSYSGFVELSRPRLSQMLSELKGNKNLLSNLNIITKLGDLSQLMEQATRVGVFKAGIGKGLSSVEAAKESREATVDFARKGSMTRDLNATIAFFNAGIQGLDKTIRTVKDDPVGATIKATAAITIPSLLLYLINRNDPEYKELPRWQKDLFWMFKINDIWFRVPKPFVYGQIFGSLPERFFEYVDSQDREAFNQYGESLYNSLSPVTGDPMSGLLPTAIRPLIENQVNYNFFSARPIVSEGKRDLIASEQYNRYNTQTSRIIGKIFNVSPSKVENLTQGWFGGMGRYSLQTSDIGLKFINALKGEPQEPGKPLELSDIILIKGFVSRDITSGQAESVRKFYDNLENISRNYLTFNKFRKEGDKEEALSLKEKHPELRLYPRFSQYARQFSQIEKKVDFIVKNRQLSGEEKKRQIKELELKKIAIAQKANELLQ